MSIAIVRARAKSVLALVRDEFIRATGHTPPIALGTMFELWAAQEREIERRDAEIEAELSTNSEARS